MITYTQDSIEKIGNTIVYLAENIPQLSKTKLLKLLYLIEEFSVKKYHAPFLGLKFEVWQAGPVAKDIFIDLSQDEPDMLSKYVQLKTCIGLDGATFIEPKVKFSDDEFSDNEISLLEFIVQQYKDSTAKDLVKLTHRANSLWYKIAKENDLLESFEQKIINSTEYQINFTELLNGDERGKDFYQEQLDFMDFASAFKK